MANKFKLNKKSKKDKIMFWLLPTYMKFKTKYLGINIAFATIEISVFLSYNALAIYGFIKLVS